MCEILEQFIPFFSCGGYICLKCFICKCECFECCYWIIWLEFPIAKTAGNSEFIGSADVSMVPHICCYIWEAGFCSDVGEYCIARTQEESEYFCSCDIVFDSICSISVSITESLILETQYRITIK